MEIRIELPNHDESIEWIMDKDVKGEMLHRIVRSLALQGETELKQILQTQLKTPTGATAASIESWLLQASKERVSYGVGSRSRGRILRWLDRGRGPVRPIRARALRFWINRRKIFAMYARATQPMDILNQAGVQAMMKADEIAKRELK